MTAYNTYINQLPQESETFSVEIQDLEYILEAFGTIVEVGSNIVKNVKKKQLEVSWISK